MDMKYLSKNILAVMEWSVFGHTLLPVDELRVIQKHMNTECHELTEFSIQLCNRKLIFFRAIKIFEL